MLGNLDQAPTSIPTQLQEVMFPQGLMIMMAMATSQKLVRLSAKQTKAGNFSLSNKI